MRHFFVFSLSLAITFAAVTAADAQSASEQGRYQIMKATEDRVWRLDTASGEIAVCTLSGENLVCTTTSEAAAVPQKSYDELEAEKAAANEEREAERAAKREQDLKMLDKILALFRELLGTALGEQ